MKPAIWQIQEAKNRLSEVVERARTQGRQTITKHGKPVAVIMSVEDLDKIERVRSAADTGASLVKLMQRCPAPEIFDVIETDREREKARDLELG